MARGWESKAIEDQVHDHENRDSASGPSLTPAERERRSKREGLMMARVKTINALKTVREDRYRDQLQCALDDLDRQIAALAKKSIH